MTGENFIQSRAVRIPSGRLSRFTRLGTLATGIAGRAAIQAAGNYRRGTRPELRDLLITPANLRRMTEELARMRGAAMKVGQLISMDAGEVLPPELAEIVARLRNEAHFMPARQLRSVLNANWGSGWLSSFRHFDTRPIAAASIGQVHKAELRDGRVVAVKVQYPGVARSIDSDVSNVGALIRLSGLLPRGFDLAPYLTEARRQLHEETDYLREGRCLTAFARRLRDDDRFLLPEYHEDWSTRDILTMSFVPGHPIETATDRPADMRNRIVRDLFDLFLVEVFAYGEMQSDPNFANYRLDPTSGRIVLLDFGATRSLDPQLVDLYRQLVAAGLNGDAQGMDRLAGRLGFFDDRTDPDHRKRILDMMETAFSALRMDEFDFADPTLSRAMQSKGQALAEAGYVPPVLPMDLLYLQRKLGGLFLLASRLGARLPVRSMVTAHLSETTHG